MFAVSPGVGCMPAGPGVIAPVFTPIGAGRGLGVPASAHFSAELAVVDPVGILRRVGGAPTQRGAFSPRWVGRQGPPAHRLAA